jgi:hypothetical protein
MGVAALQSTPAFTRDFDVAWAFTVYIHLGDHVYGLQEMVQASLC